MAADGFYSGAEVAVVVSPDAAATSARELAIVEFVGIGYIQLSDGRMYDKAGKRLSKLDPTFIVLATDEHRRALE